jgi:hypothetical protein
MLLLERFVDVKCVCTDLSLQDLSPLSVQFRVDTPYIFLLHADVLHTWQSKVFIRQLLSDLPYVQDILTVGLLHCTTRLVLLPKEDVQ